MEDFKREDHHESYGKIRISKISGGLSLFDSEVGNGGAILIQISTARLNRGLNHNWIHSDKELVEVYLSPLQWAEAITTAMNTDGVPCTLNRVMGKTMERTPENDVIGQFEDEVATGFEQRMKDVVEAENRIRDILATKGAIKKGELREAYDILNKGLRHFESNMNYTKKCFDEQMDKTVLEAKQQIHHYVNTTIQELGIESLKDLQNVKLVGYDKQE